MTAFARRFAFAALALAACTAGSGSDAPTVPRTYTFKALSGVSMGAIGAAFLAGSGDHGKEIDAVGSLGGPMDAAWFLAGLERMQFGGFCPYDRLVALAESVGLSAEEARRVLDERTEKAAVDDDWKRVRAMGVTGVPTFVANGYGVVGAQPYEVLERLVEEAGGVRRQA